MALYAIAKHFYDIVQAHAILTPATVKCMDGMLISPSLLCIKSDVTQHNFLKLCAPVVYQVVAQQNSLMNNLELHFLSDLAIHDTDTLKYHVRQFVYI